MLPILRVAWGYFLQVYCCCSVVFFIHYLLLQKAPKCCWTWHLLDYFDLMVNAWQSSFLLKGVFHYYLHLVNVDLSQFVQDKGYIHFLRFLLFICDLDGCWYLIILTSMMSYFFITPLAVRPQYLHGTFRLPLPPSLLLTITFRLHPSSRLITKQTDKINGRGPYTVSPSLIKLSILSFRPHSLLGLKLLLPSFGKRVKFKKPSHFFHRRRIMASTGEVNEVLWIFFRGNLFVSGRGGGKSLNYLQKEKRMKNSN